MHYEVWGCAEIFPGKRNNNHNRVGFTVHHAAIKFHAVADCFGEKFDESVWIIYGSNPSKPPNNIYKGNSVLYTEFITKIGHRKELQSRGFERWPLVKAKCIFECLF